MDSYEVIVVGAGVMGSWTAYILASRNVKVLLVDQFPLPHSRGSSHGQSRGIRMAYINPVETSLVKMSYPYWHRLQQQSKQQILFPCQLLNVAGQRRHADLEEKIKSIHSVSPTGYEVLSNLKLKQKFPFFTFPENYKGVLDFNAGVLRADKTLLALQDLFKKMGGKILDGFKIVNISSGESVKVSGNKGEYSAKKLIICAGPWTNDVLSLVNLKVPLQPIRVVAPYFCIKEGYSYPNITYIDDGDSENKDRHVYGIPPVDYPNMVKVAPHHGINIHPDERDLVEVTELLRFTSEHVRAKLQNLDPNPRIVEYCIYTKTPDDLFILDQHPQFPNIIYACGFSGSGFKISPIIGEILSDISMDCSPAIDCTPFKASRFANTSKL